MSHARAGGGMTPLLPMHRVAASAAPEASLLKSKPAGGLGNVDFLARLEQLEKAAEPAALWGGAPAAHKPDSRIAQRQQAKLPPRVASMDNDACLDSLKQLEEEINRKRQRNQRGSTPPEKRVGGSP